MTLCKWPSHQLQPGAVGQSMHIAELRTIVSISFQFSGPGMSRWLLPEQPLGCYLTWQHIQHFPRAPLGFDTSLWSILSCHTILGQSGHCGGAEQWQAEALVRAVCWGGGLNTVQKIWLLKRNKGHVRAAALVLSLSWAWPICSPDVKMILQPRRIRMWPLIPTDGTMNDLYRLNCVKKAKILSKIQQATLTMKRKFG